MSYRPALARRLAVVAVGAVVAVPLLATAASAHVAVSSGDAVRGGEAGLLTFRVPNESATAGTVKVTINLPTDQPVAFADTQQVPGWTVSTTERKLPAATKIGDFTLTKVTSSVTWTAGPGVRIGPDQFQLFQLLVGPLPDASTMVFSAVQVYSDRTIVKWDEPYPASGDEPEHPTPVLELVAETAATPVPTESASPLATAAPAVTVPVADQVQTTSDRTARILGGAGLVVGAIGLLFGGVGLRRRRSSSASPSGGGAEQ